MVMSAAELQLRRGKDMVAIGNTDVETVDRGGGSVHDAQGRGGNVASTKNGASILDLTGDTEVGR